MTTGPSDSLSQEQWLERIRKILGLELGIDFITAWLHYKNVKPLLFLKGRPPRLPIPGVPFIARTLYHAWPGVGKTEAVKRLAETGGAAFPTLVLGLSHKSFENVTRAEGWAHWKGHDSISKGDPTTCPVNVRISKGYRPKPRECTCDTERTLKTGGPTFAPVEYVLADSPTGGPLTEKVYEYGLWVFDEVDFAKFVGKMVVTKRDVDFTGDHHPSETLRRLAQALQMVMSQHTAANRGKRRYQDQVHWYGAELYARLDAAMKLLEGSLSDFAAAFATLDDLPADDAWTGDTDEGHLPCNFAPRLSEVIRNEVLAHLGGKPFNPRIHLAWDSPEEGQPVQSVLRISWKKHVAYLWAPIIVLDASADQNLLGQVFGPIDAVRQAVEPELPETVWVHQLVGERVPKSTLGIGPGGGKKKLPAK